jgi:acetyl-CoA acetyltransferase
MESLRDKVAIVGIGETEYSWKLNRGARELITEAVFKALDDAKISAKDIDGIVTETSWVQQFMNHAELAHGLGINLNYSGTIGTTGNGNVASFHLAAKAITAGQAETVLTYFTNGYGSQQDIPKTVSGERRVDITRGIKDSFEVPYGSNGPRIYFAQVANRYMYEHGLTSEQFSRQLGAVAISHRRNAVLNGRGVEKEPLTYEDYLNSPMIADPLRLYDYCRWNDGACAWVVTSAERAKDFPHVPVYVTGIGSSYTGEARGDYWTQGGKNYCHKPHMAVALDRALQMAGISRGDLDFAQIYDAYTIMFLIFLESLGFCKKGEGGAFVESGAISLEGSIPINTHGGNLSHSYINMASHIVEAVRQLRGEAGACQIKDAEFGMVEGGSSWEEYVTLFRRG